MDKEALEKVADTSPLRCQAITAFGQCSNKVVEEYNLCPIHIARNNETINEEKKRIYRLTLYRARVHELADHGELTNLREEVGILRMVLEQLLEQCVSPTDLIIHANRISELVRCVQKLVGDCHRLDKYTAKYLDKTAILKIAGDIVDILGNNIDDLSLLERISGEIMDKIINAQSTTKDD